jgi:hypothetical protein
LATLAERREDVQMAETAVSQAEAAYALFRDSKVAFHVEFYARQLPGIRHTYDRLIGNRRTLPLKSV